jgi:hypothetical protein
MREMAADISEAFGVPSGEVEGQVRTLIRSFRKVGLLEPTGASRRREVLADA